MGNYIFLKINLLKQYKFHISGTIPIHDVSYTIMQRKMIGKYYVINQVKNPRFSCTIKIHFITLFPN